MRRGVSAHLLACSGTHNPRRQSVYKDGSVDKNRLAEKSGPQLTLIDCLRCFTVTEKLGPKDEWYCPSCKVHVQAFKQLELWKVPNILVVHLKRFQVGQWNMREKLNSMVDFPLTEFDLAPYVLDPRQKQESLLYDLFAVAVRRITQTHRHTDTDTDTTTQAPTQAD